MGNQREGGREDERLVFCPEVSEDGQGLEDECLALGLVLSVEDEFSRGATSLAEVTTKLVEAKTQLREAVGGAVWRRFFGRHYISAAELEANVGG